MKGDVAAFRAALSERADDFVAVSQRGKAAGAVHHQFGIGDDYVLVIDEWDSPANFEQFFSDPELQKFIGDVGGDTSAPPDITIAEAVDSSDKF
jgi:quinol monooxygenase YgiN